MGAADVFLEALSSRGERDRVDRVQVVLYGSLAKTGRGHGTGKALQLGLMGEDYERIDPGIDGAGLRRTWTVMKECAYRGCHAEGELPGGLQVTRRGDASTGSCLLHTWRETAGRTGMPTDGTLVAAKSEAERRGHRDAILDVFECIPYELIEPHQPTESWKPQQPHASRVRTLHDPSATCRTGWLSCLSF